MNYTDFGEIYEDECIGQSFGPKDQLEIIGWTHKGKDGKKLYVVKCKECTKDPELFGEGLFISGRSNLSKGQIPCGCSKNQFGQKIN